jgi:XTP/dITP diphosphohydrolase
MKLLYGTGNPAKLAGLDIEVIGLKEVEWDVGLIDESGNDPLQNARIKALAYYRAGRMPVFSCDSGLYLEGVPPELQPGVHVRRVGGRTLDDQGMIEYYTALAARRGGIVKARYRNAICLVLDEENICEYDGEDICSEEFLLVTKTHPHRVEGFPLDSISVEVKSGKYYMDLEEEAAEESKFDLRKGFRDFFIRSL